MDAIKEGLLKIEPGLFIWAVITFIVMLLILWKAAWRPIVDALDTRAEKVRGDIDNADKARQEAEALLTQYKDMMQNAKDDAAKFITQGKEEAERLKTEIVDKATADARDLAYRATREIALAKDAALEEIKNEVVTLSTEIASKIISKSINPEDQKSLVEETLNKVKTVQ